MARSCWMLPEVSISVLCFIVKAWSTCHNCYEYFCSFKITLCSLLPLRHLSIACCTLLLAYSAHLRIWVEFQNVGWTKLKFYFYQNEDMFMYRAVPLAMQSYFYLLARIDIRIRIDYWWNAETTIIHQEIWCMNWKELCIWMKTQKEFWKSVKKLRDVKHLYRWYLFGTYFSLFWQKHVLHCRNINILISKRFNGLNNVLVILQISDSVFFLFVLRLNVPVNNFSVMSGRSHRFQGN